MVSWKDKGEVPDSEDEGEDDDSQNIFNEGYRDGPLQKPQRKNSDIQITTGDICEARDLVQIPTDVLRVSAFAHLNEAVERPELSLSPRIFKIPPPSIEFRQLPDSQETGPQLDLQTDEQVSQSYIQISCLPSNSNTRPYGIEKSDDAETTTQTIPSTSRFKDNNITADQGELDYADVVAHTDSLCSTRRPLRQRNPIQLHPYALEGEKYRRTLMSRGMRPLRLEQVRDHRTFNRAHSSPDTEFDTQDENRAVSFEDETPPPVQSQNSRASDLSTLSSIDGRATQSGGEDDEFPDINQLLDTNHNGLLQPAPKRRKTTYGSRRVSRFPSSSIIPITYEGQSNPSRNIEAADIPPSPPATSSPVPIFHAPFSLAGSKHIATNLTSSRAASIENVGSERVVGQEVAGGNLPTPMTNSVRHTIDLTAELQSDEDPFVSDIDLSPIFSSSDNEEAVQVRRVGKKIRGVLPASWLRLDQQTRHDGNSSLTAREIRSTSPVKAALSRRGVAVPKDNAHEICLDPVESTSDNLFLMSDSDTEDEFNLPAVFEHGPDLLHQSKFSQTDTGSIMEDNQVDHMLPSRKRQIKLANSNLIRRRRPVSNSLFTRRDNGPHHQPKITDHLQIARAPKHGSSKTQRHRINRSGHRKTSRFSRSQGYPQKSVPNLSILDVIDSYSNDRERPPIFIRIAARNARLSSRLGRHSPTRKYIRLANRADTQDAQSVLRDWREGNLRPCTEVPEYGKVVGARLPLSDISENVRSTAVSAPRAERDFARDTPRLSIPSRKMVLPIESQTRPVHGVQSQALSERRHVLQARPKALQSRIWAATPSAMRPAQLETSVADYRTHHPNQAFGSTKKILDRLYRNAQKEEKQSREFQLSHFFRNDDFSQVEQPLTVNDQTNGFDQSKRSLAMNRDAIQRARRHKQIPKRIDATAAIFRQPSELLILDPLPQVHGTQEELGNKGKLQGLGKFGTTYTYHFDVLPLQPETFFHESTFIGSGRLSEALEISSRSFDGDRGSTNHHVCGKHLQWGPWDSIVSSELGIIFDWMSEQLEDSTNTLCQCDKGTLIGCINHVVDYVQNNLTFRDLSSHVECLLRIADILHCFMKHLEVLANRIDIEAERLSLLIELSCRLMVISFQFLRIAQSNPAEIDSMLRFENMIHKSAMLTIRLLLSHGLDLVRKLCESLQYLAQRIRGIQRDEYAAQAWVITMHILHAARLPRISFWDVLNFQLVPKDDGCMSDANVLERIWYDMFSLLPLTEFNANGVLVRGVKCLESFENWAIPQKIAKKIFELYNSKSRQSPTFNDYCRALFNRCCYLMQTWGWRRHGIIVGTLFDFFATRKLAHLRNEEVYTSPRFLEELDQNPTLTIDIGDRCFHILLKIIAVSIKQMRDVEDVKGVRNLVTRVLPNHDRQYPKEKNVYQRDLASLRNHHDLLCTLFWVSPPDLRPSITLLRELVNPESSHHEAYSINLRAWENLMRFVLGSDPTITAYLPLAKWHYESFTQLVTQYKSAEKDIQDQLRELPSAAQKLISAQIITTTIQDNRKQVIVALALTLEAFKRSIKMTSNVDSVIVVAFNEYSKACLITGLGLYQVGFSDVLPVVETALDILSICGDRFIDSTQNAEKLIQNFSEDSQEYGSDMFSGLEIETIELVGHLNGELLGSVRDILRTSLQSGKMIEYAFRRKIVEVWAMIASALVIAKTYDLSDFVCDSGSLHDLSMDNESPCVRQYASYFLKKVVTRIRDPTLLITTGRDLLSDWLCILIKPEEHLHSEHELLDYFCRGEPVVERGLKNFLINRLGNKRSMHKLDSLKAGREALLYSTFQSMEAVLREEPSEGNRFQKIVRKVEAYMKSDLIAMTPRLPQTVRHENFVKSVRLLLFTFFRDLCGIKIANEFSNGTYTYPGDSHSHDDSRMFIATIRNYCLRLDLVRGKNELNHYILAVLKYAATAGNLFAISESLQEAMDNEPRTWQELSHHILMVLTPSFIHAAFASQTGWLLVEPFFDAAQEHLLGIASHDREGAIRGVTKIMSSIMNGISNLMDARSIDNRRTLIQHGLLYLLLMSARFMSLVFDWLPYIMEICIKEQKELKDIAAFMAFFHHFACGAKSYLCSPHKWYINSLKRYRNLIAESTALTDRDDREARIDAYEESMENGPGGDINPALMFAREQALRNLITPFSGDEAEFNDTKIIFEYLHNNKSSSGPWLFYDMRKTAFFVKAKNALPHHSEMEPPPFSSIILADYRQNWADTVINGGIEIKFGQDKHIATDLAAYKFSPQQLGEELMIALGDYINRYEQVYGQSAGKQIIKYNRKYPVKATQDLML